jgi:CheY-like chemotaxis protein
VVEDDEATREMMRKMLQQEHYTVVEAENGRVGLEQIAQALPDLILLDLMMPEMDGFQFIQALRANPAWRGIPIVVVTAMELTMQDRMQLNGYVEPILQKGAYSRDELLQDVREMVIACLRDRNRSTVEESNA